MTLVMIERRSVETEPRDAGPVQGAHQRGTATVCRAHLADKGIVFGSLAGRIEQLPDRGDLAGDDVVDPRVGRFQEAGHVGAEQLRGCLLYTSPSPRDRTRSRMPSSA